MAKEIKGARFLLSKMLETLGLDQNDQTFRAVMSSNVKQDVMGFQNLTKKLLFAVEKGMIKKIKPPAIRSMKKPEQGDDVKQVKTKSTVEVVERASSLCDATKKTMDADITTAVSSARLPRIEEFVEMPPEVNPRKTGAMINRYCVEQRKTLKPAFLHHVHGIQRKKRWSLNRGAPRQAFATRRNC